MNANRLREEIDSALNELRQSSIDMIKLGIEQHGKIGHYGRLAITNAIIKRLQERKLLS